MMPIKYYKPLKLNKPIGTFFTIMTLCFVKQVYATIDVKFHFKLGQCTAVTYATGLEIVLAENDKDDNVVFEVGMLANSQSWFTVNNPLFQ
jgi:hypothetical protein